MKIREIAELVGGTFRGDGSFEITSVADITTAVQGSLAFWTKHSGMPATDASCVIVPVDYDGTEPAGAILVKNPKLAFASVAKALYPTQFQTGVHKSAFIADNTDVKAAFVGAFVSVNEGTRIGEASQIYDGVRIGRGVQIGKRTVIYPNCTIYDGTSIGNDCVIHSGAVIGADGFGYVKDEHGDHIQFPQIGRVIVEDHVDIGANTCIDRGALGETRIGEGTKIDNLVQVGHNVSIGRRCVIASQTGISGSVVIEDDCVIGGQVGFGDHARVQKGTVIGSQAGVLPGKIVRPGVWWGTPIRPLEEFKRRNALLNRIETIVTDIAHLKRSMKDRS